MSINYEIVFTVEMLNDYFFSQQCTALDIVAADDTINVLKGQQMLCKTIGNKFITINKIDDTGKPYVALDKSRILRFYITINDTNFINYSNINYQPADAGKYYFTNINQTKLGTVLYLHQAIDKYDNSQTYAIGNLAADNTNNVFEAIKASDSGNKHALTETAYWLPKGKAQFVNNKDGLLFTGSNYTAAAASATDFTINIYGLKTSNNTYSVLMRTATQHYESAQTSVPVDLSGLPFGKYKVSVNTSDSFVYYDEIAVKQNILGVIEIFNHLPAGNNFSLFDASGVSKQSKFTLRFANRSAVWRYFTRTTDVDVIKDTASVYTFNSVAASKVFTSAVPIPLKERPITTISAHGTKLGNVAPLANPGVNRVNQIMQNGEIYYCIEKHLNF
ncbi:hypothetical protein ACFGVS_18005 [Mucilaginibacter sp. AW1-7]|uniref:hypothetical protein n=1 Tax=Mucilaginibacter sp. AW1-7 TaxID=3349874 RepID=UPI003F738C4E